MERDNERLAVTEGPGADLPVPREDDDDDMPPFLKAYLRETQPDPKPEPENQGILQADAPDLAAADEDGDEPIPSAFMSAVPTAEDEIPVSTRDRDGDGIPDDDLERRIDEAEAGDPEEEHFQRRIDDAEEGDPEEESIDTSDIPEAGAEWFEKAQLVQPEPPAEGVLDAGWDESAPAAVETSAPQPPAIKEVPDKPAPKPVIKEDKPKTPKKKAKAKRATALAIATPRKSPQAVRETQFPVVMGGLGSPQPKAPQQAPVAIRGCTQVRAIRLAIREFLQERRC